MWFMTRLAIVFYTILIWCTSIAVMLFVLHVLDYNTVTQLLAMVYEQPHVGAVVFGIACGIIIMSVVLENIIYGRRRRERTIAFESAGGPVAVSLSALEDLVKRLTVNLPEIKEIRATVLAIKKGLDIDIKLILRAQTNIPDLTAKLQDLVRRKIEETIDMEGKINIRIHVIKISLEDIKGGRRPVEINEPRIPFRGYNR